MAKYLIALLAMIVLFLGGATYYLSNELNGARASVLEWQETARRNEDAVRVAGGSCKASHDAISAAQRSIDVLSEGRSATLEELATLPQVTLPEIHINAITEHTAPQSKAVVKPPISRRLTPDTMRLLDNAYCSGAENDLYCTSRRAAGSL